MDSKGTKQPDAISLKSGDPLFFAGLWEWNTKLGAPGKLRPTAAMMAGVTNRLWKFDHLYAEAIIYG